MPFGFKTKKLTVIPSKAPKRLLMVLNLDRAFLTHRLPIALAAREAGYEVHVALHITDAEEEIKQHGFAIHPLKFGRGVPSILSEWKGFLGLLHLLIKLKPHVVHLVTARPVIYGGMVARLLGIPTLAAIPGLGSAYLMKGAKGLLLRKALGICYRIAVSHSKCRIIVQNPDDEKMVHEEFNVPISRIRLVPGSGADLAQYPCLPEPEEPIRVILASRLLIDKGVREFIEAASKVHEHHPNVQFLLAGASDVGNPTSLSSKELEDIKQLDYMQVLGHQPHLATLFGKCHIVVLPSYREGLPKVLIEAAACGRSVITTDVPGCRDAITSDTGLLVPVRDASALSKAIITLVNDTTQRQRMGLAGRALAEKKFDINIVVASHLKDYQTLAQGNVVLANFGYRSIASYLKTLL